MSAFPLPVIAVSGPPAECGAAYGAAAADLIAANNATYLRRFETRAGLSVDTVRTWGDAFRATTHEYQPRLGAMLDGVAEGSGVPAAEIYAMNGRTELLYGAGKSASRAAEVRASGASANGSGDGECTAIGLIGDGTLIGQNWDWHPDQRPYCL